MIRINLLPFRESRKKENVKRTLLIYIIVLAVFIGALYAVNKHLDDKITDFTNRINYTKKEIDKYNKINQEIAELRAYLAQLNTKLEIIANLESSRHTTVTLMDNLTQTLVPDSMWLTSLVTTGNTSATVDGMATDNKVVADFMLNLENMPRYTQIYLRSVKQTEISTRPLKQFTVTFNLKIAPPLDEMQPTTAAAGR